MRLRISSTLLARLHAIAAADPAREVCGLLLGTDGMIAAIAEADNVAADPRTGFEIDPATHFAAIKAARAGGPTILGSYHSHPSGCVRPSLRDLGMAHPGEVWLILATGDVAAWHREGTKFQELTLDVS